MRLRKDVEEMGSIHVADVAVDIEDTFDNLWWALVYRWLSNARVSAYLGRIVRLLEGQQIVIHLKFAEYTKEIKRGYPQSFVLDPLPWKLVFNDLVERVGQTIKVVAYADDLLILIRGNSKCEWKEVNVGSWGLSFTGWKIMGFELWLQKR